MAYEIPGRMITLVAGADLSADQFKLVTLANDGQIDVTGNTSTNDVTGVLQNKPSAAGYAASVMMSGVSKVIAGETINEGDLLTPSAVTAGRVDVADAATNRIIGRALTAGAAGEVISMDIQLSGAKAV